MVKLSIDLETYSDEDIKFGVYKYTDSPNFEILLFAYSINEGTVEVLDLTYQELPDWLVEHILDPNVVKTAYNAQFERVALTRYLNRLGVLEGFLDPSQWRCTMVKAQEMGLPASLKQCAIYLGIEEQKDTAGTHLINFFSKPCKPTKANGMRSRNLPEHDPEKWEAFRSYCAQDVRVELAIADKLSGFRIPEKEWEHYSLDQRIHDRGVGIDLELAEGAIAIDESIREANVGRLKEITGLENPNSVSQLKDWFASQGHPFPTLSKSILQEYVDQRLVTGTVKEAVELRLNLSNSSTKKYVMMEEALCSDGRLHGLLQFYGASRTGRYAGRLLQVQNLPRNYLEPLEAARDLVKLRDKEGLELLFGDVPDTLKQLIRTGIIAKEGYTFHVSDFSAIEARVIAWYAGEEKVLEAFRTHGKIYEATAANMFNLGPVETYDWSTDIGKAMRQRGKVATLACIAKGEKVLTDRGLVAIEDVTLKHKVWDGENWVTHDGVVYKGVKEVITYEGLTATGDHIVWAEVSGEHKQIQFEEAFRRGYRIVQSGAGRDPIRLGENNRSNQSMEKRLERSKGDNPMHRMSESKMVQLLQLEKRKIKRLSKLFAKKASSEVARASIYGCETKMHKPEQSGVQKLRGERDRIQIRNSNRSCEVYDRESRFTRKSSIRDRQNRQQRTLRAWEPEMGDQIYASKKSTQVYDILNAGPNHRFTVNDKLVHNCGYQGGPGALVAMGALNMGIPEDELQDLVDGWRKANPRIKQFWYDVQAQAIKAMESGRIVKGAKGLKFFKKGDFLFIHLPSGRCLAYAKPRLEEGKYGPSLTYEGQGSKVFFEKEHTYGGKLVENIVQATARDILAEALLRLDAEGYEIVFHVHDEAVCEVPEGKWTIDKMNQIMAETPKWAQGLPLGAEGYETKFYKKD